jgi:carboxypeptidase PM20D1
VAGSFRSSAAAAAARHNHHLFAADVIPMRMLKLLALLVLALGGILAYNTLRLPARWQAPGTPPQLPLDEAAIAGRLAGAVRIPTISFEQRAQIDAPQLELLAAYLVNSFPRVHAALTRERVGTHSLLFTWPGRDATPRHGTAHASPILLLAHMDVVPIEPGTESRWTHPPFSGAIADGYIWGRGTLDDKSSLIAWLEAVELLLSQGFQPGRTIYFAFGQDEEIGGKQGAKLIAELLRSRGIKAEFSLDEGGAITQGIVAGVAAPVASIMTAEKGYVSFRLTSRSKGGHSSMPPMATAAGQLARAVSRVQEQQMPVRLAPPATDMLERLAPEMPLMQRAAIANRWLLAPLIAGSLTETPVSNALVRTTTAPTILSAGIKDNVLPSEAHAVINFRLLPGDSVADVEQHLRKVIGDEGIEIRIEGEIADAASAVSPTDSPAFQLLARTVNETFPEAVVTTGIVTGATDNRHYGGIYQTRYNFLPMLLKPEDLARIHGTDERIGVKAYADMVRFYIQLLKNAAT